MENKNKIGKGTIAVLVVGVVACVIIGILDTIYQQRIENNPRYTIGKPIKVWYTKMSYDYDYVYSVDKKQYKRRSRRTDLKSRQVIGKWFYVKFEMGNPENANILFDMPVHDSTMFIPTGGYKEYILLDSLANIRNNSR